MSMPLYAVQFVDLIGAQRATDHELHIGLLHRI